MAASAKDFSTRSTTSGCSTACARRWWTTAARWATSRRPTWASRPPARRCKRAGVPGEHIGSVITGNMAPGDFDQFFLPRHIGLYAGVPVEVPAHHGAAHLRHRLRAVPPGRRADPGRPVRGGAGGGHREHDAQPDRRLRPPHRLQAGRAGGLQGLHVGSAERPGRRHQHDPDRREPGEEVRHHPRRGGRSSPPTRSPRPWRRRRAVFSPARSCR